MTFTTNIGTADAIIRIALGAVLLGLTAFGVIGLWGLIGIVPVGTAFLKFCPAYAVFGLRTCRSAE